ncbi:unnamed protein product [Arabidopsis thaliana]|uniref:Protein kinase domain-containing protein n=1 Tax=Arabidopsis thaliana TaxID=3702 RepID=A0A654FNB6_ARATH|nr:unnamed protein product [Arabidopsis thaliana]
MWREKLSIIDPLGILISFDSRRVNLLVVLTPTHLAIEMEYASRGELFERICNASRFSEAELICGVDYCHSLVFLFT